MRQPRFRGLQPAARRHFVLRPSPPALASGAGKAGGGGECQLEPGARGMWVGTGAAGSQLQSPACPRPPATLRPVPRLPAPRAHAALPAGGTPGVVSPGGDQWTRASRGSACGNAGRDLGGARGGFIAQRLPQPRREAGFSAAPWFLFRRMGDGQAKGRKGALGTQVLAGSCRVLPWVGARPSPTLTCRPLHAPEKP